MGGVLNLIQEAPVVETRVEEESRRLGELSVSTLEYIADHGIAKELRLRHHRGNLGFLAEEEHDLLEAMRLSARLNRVDVNIARTGRANERVRAELVRRAIEEA